MNDSKIDEFLEHFGTKGMKWGSRKPGTGKPSSHKAKVTQKPKAKDLSDEELRSAVNRMNMERQYNSLVRGQTNTPARRAVRTGAAFAGGIALNVARTQIQNQASRRVGQMLAGT